MRSTFKVLFFLKRDKQKKNGKAPLFCRITVDGKEIRFGMKKDIHPGYWDVKAGKATGRTGEATEINALIDSSKSAIYKVYRDLQERDNSVTAEKVRNIFLGINGRRKNLLETFDEHNREKKLLVGVNISMSLYDKYRITRDHLAEFLMNRYNLSEISLKDIDLKFIENFKIFLLTSRKCSENTTVSYLKLFKHLLVEVFKYGWIYENPFVDYPLKINPVDRGYLTQEEVETLIGQTFYRKRLEWTRDLFVFCCFTGLSYIDVKNFTSENICTSFDGKPWIMGKRGKTKVVYTIPLLEIPKKILEKYSGKLRDGRLPPPVGNCIANLYLKEIGAQCGIKKKLTFHYARHVIFSYH